MGCPRVSSDRSRPASPRYAPQGLWNGSRVAGICSRRATSRSRSPSRRCGHEARTSVCKINHRTTPSPSRSSRTDPATSRRWGKLRREHPESTGWMASAKRSRPCHHATRRHEGSPDLSSAFHVYSAWAAKCSRCTPDGPPQSLVRTIGVVLAGGNTGDEQQVGDLLHDLERIGDLATSAIWRTGRSHSFRPGEHLPAYVDPEIALVVRVPRLRVPTGGRGTTSRGDHRHDTRSPGLR